MNLRQRNHPIEALSSYRPDHAFTNRVRFRARHWGSQYFDPQRPDRVIKVRPGAVTDEFRNRTLDLLETVVHIAATRRIGIGKHQLVRFRKRMPRAAQTVPLSNSWCDAVAQRSIRRQSRWRLARTSACGLSLPFGSARRACLAEELRGQKANGLGIVS